MEGKTFTKKYWGCGPTHCLLCGDGFMNTLNTHMSTRNVFIIVILNELLFKISKL